MKGHDMFTKFITATEALKLESAKLTDEQIKIANKILEQIDDAIRNKGLMKNNGFQFTTNNTDPSAMFEVVYTIQEAGFIVNCQPIEEQSRFNPNQKDSQWVSAHVHPEQRSNRSHEKDYGAPMTKISTGIAALDEVLGGGFTPGSFNILMGPRGVGKTALLLQAGKGFAQKGRRSFFACGEMLRKDLLLYQKRLRIKNPFLFVFSHAEGIDVETLIDDTLTTKAKLLIIDSAQTMYLQDVKANTGNSHMVYAASHYLKSFAEKTKVAVVVIYRQNHDGSLTGSKRIENLADTVLRIDHVCEYVYKISADKNRFAPLHETVFELTEEGFKSLTLETAKEALIAI